MPSDAKRIADWHAPFRPMTLLRRPYSGVKVQVAKRYLSTKVVEKL